MSNVSFEKKIWGDLATLEYGKGLRDYVDSSGAFRVYGTNGPIGWHSEALCPHPGIVIGRKGAYRGVHYSQHPFFVIDTAFYLKPRTSDLDMKWAYYQLLTQDINGMDSGSAIPSTSRDAFYQLSVSFPSLLEQRAIAHVLGALDDKIELNRRMNATLEAMAQTLFRSWFVDFDPVRAKAEGREPEGMDAETAALFPSALLESELGFIPKGWRVGSIYDIASVRYGAPFASNLFNTAGKGLPLIRIRDLPTGLPAFYTEQSLPRQTLIEPGDVVVGMDGEFRAYHWKGETALLNQRCCNFLPNTNIGRVFVSESLRKPLDFVEQSETATTVIHLGKADIDLFRVVIPDEQVNVAFGRLSERFLDKRIRLWQENRTLIALRDELLPKLISGEIRLPEALVAEFADANNAPNVIK